MGIIDNQSAQTSGQDEALTGLSSAEDFLRACETHDWDNADFLVAIRSRDAAQRSQGRREVKEEELTEFRMDELDAVMLSVDKWLDGPALRNNPATRAADAREFALRSIEKEYARGKKEGVSQGRRDAAEAYCKDICGCREADERMDTGCRRRKAILGEVKP
jgi:flagellar biosynthesis/type III secretory pathway protein FliH